MANSSYFEIKKYNFSKDLQLQIADNIFVKDFWPLVYILSDGNKKLAYVGETADAISRMSAHLKNVTKNKLTSVHLVTSDKFNKSATLDIESNLIKYLHGDGQFTLLNANLGIADHNFYEKNGIYSDIFKTLWSELKREGIAQKSLEQIDNSDIFKYSPFKSLTKDQLKSIIKILKSLVSHEVSRVVVQGGAGTGKTILAIFLFKLLGTNIDEMSLEEFGDEETELINLVREFKIKFPISKMALVVPMAGFRRTLQRSFARIRGLKPNMVIGPAQVVDNKYDLIIVDESHRLRKRINLGAYFGAFDKANRKLGLIKEKGNELDWVQMQSKKLVLFYDIHQTIKPSDVDKTDFERIIESKKTVIENLVSQLRVKGGNDYISYVNKLLENKFRKEDKLFKSKDYEFLLFDSLQEMIDKVKFNDNMFGLSRLVAGYSWEWVSKKTRKHDIEIDGIKLYWNSVADDWMNSKNSLNEVGCIHTTQGYDLNYTGVIFGNEIAYDKLKDEIYIKPENYHDQNGNHKNLTKDELKNYILNIYKTLMFRGIKGTYIFVCDEKLREYFKKHILTFGSTNDKFDPTQVISPYRGNTVSIPLVGSAPCGNPLVGEANIEEYIEVEENKIKKGFDYFILRAEGDSMNKAGINDGDLVLCRQQLKAETGDRVVALLNDEYVTIKKYDRRDGRRILLPQSTNLDHKPIIPEEGDSVQGVVQEVL